MKKVLLLTLLLAGCSVTDVVTEPMIQKGNEACTHNEGLSVIRYADIKSIYESCGFKCSVFTGTRHSATIECHNGAVFNIVVFIPKPVSNEQQTR